MRLLCWSPLQRWVAMTLGRPVLVLRGYANPLGGFCGGLCCVGGRLLLSGVEWAGERCHDVHVLVFVLRCDQILV